MPPGVNRTLREWATLSLIGLAVFPVSPVAQQLGDSLFVPTVSAPVFPRGEGPRVLLDEAHVNFHTLSGRFQAFANLLRADGFVVRSGGTRFTPELLAGADLLVIANALNARNKEDWSLPTPSAFSSAEIAVVRQWVDQGGALLLIADHMPFPGAADAMAASFGFEFNNGFAMDTTAQGPLVFRRADGSLGTHAVTEGAGPEERVDSIATFTGQAFRAPAEATSVLTFAEGYVSLMPDEAWEFEPSTTSVDVAGWSQGAVMDVGQGRIAVFGEAAMFTAQRTGPQGAPMGMNAPVASQNPQFVANLVRWLTRVR
jgi:uncharacterized protein (DUF2249 family)